jgi:hypothetical protein
LSLRGSHVLLSTAVRIYYRRSASDLRSEVGVDRVCDRLGDVMKRSRAA